MVLLAQPGFEEEWVGSLLLSFLYSSQSPSPTSDRDRASRESWREWAISLPGHFHQSLKGWNLHILTEKSLFQTPFETKVGMNYLLQGQTNDYTWTNLHLMKLCWKENLHYNIFCERRKTQNYYLRNHNGQYERKYLYLRLRSQNTEKYYYDYISITFSWVHNVLYMYTVYVYVIYSFLMECV